MVFCELTKKDISINDAREGFSVRPSILKLIQEVEPNFSNDSWISRDELKKFKSKYLESYLEKEEGGKEEINKIVAQAVSNHDFLSIDYLDSINEKEDKKSITDIIADKVSEFGGSWSFIFFFFVFVLAWCFLNTYILTTKSFDPYPYIFLNLVLGCVASIQAPIIMISQNRASEMDRKRALNDFKVNLKSEFEIMILREKINHIIHQQNPHIREVIEDHSDLLEDIRQTLIEIKTNKNKNHEQIL